MGKQYIGLSPEGREREARQKILSLLPEDQEVSWQFLAEEAEKQGISKATLSKHLKRFVEIGFVKRRVDVSTYPPRTYYRKIKDVEQVFLKIKEAFIGGMKEMEKILNLMIHHNLNEEILINKISDIKRELNIHMQTLKIFFLVNLFVPPLENEEEIQGLINSTEYRLEDLREMFLYFLKNVAKLMVSLNNDEKRAIQEILIQPLIEEVEKQKEMAEAAKIERKAELASILIKKIKKEYELSEDEWTDLESGVYCMVADGHSLEEIEKFVGDYLKDKKKK